MTEIYDALVQTEELAAHLEDPAWVIVDSRFDLLKPDQGEHDYAQNHIPGAVYAHLERDLSGPVTPATGRHPLPQPAEFIARLSAWGIDARKQVVVYDAAGGAFAARLWWMLQFYRHKAVAVLDGGYAKWTRENRPLRSGVETSRPGHFSAALDHSMLVDTAWVEHALHRPEILLIDARSPERFRGESEPIDPVAGHIPGAVNRFNGDNLAPDGTLLPPSQLRAQFQSLVGKTPPQNVVVYCGSGVTSCHHILAMRAAGLGMPRLYAGSWSEWIRDPSRPIAVNIE